MNQRAETRGKQLARELSGKHQMLEIGLVNRLRMVGEQAGDLLGGHGRASLFVICFIVI